VNLPDLICSKRLSEQSAFRTNISKKTDKSLNRLAASGALHYQNVGQPLLFDRYGRT
jgi:hypothetical protein